MAFPLDWDRRLPFLRCPTIGSVTENPKRALLVIDVQNEYFTGKLPITYPAGSLANVLCAMDAALDHGVLGGRDSARVTAA